MKKIKLLTAIATATVPLSLVATSCSQANTTEVYRDINIDEDWTFRLNDDVEEQTIDLPHDFSIVQNFKHSKRDLTHNQTSGTTGFLPGGVGYYHKDFVLPKKNNPTVILNFDGAYNDTLVTVNGQIVGNNKYGYNPFAFDISNYVTADGQTVNTLDVIVRHEYVTSSRWYPGSGIYRDVTVSVLDKVHVAHNGTYVTTPNLKQEVGKDVTVNVEVDVQNSYDDTKSVHVNNRVVDLSGNGVSQWVTTPAEAIAGQSTVTFNSQLTVDNPNLWSAETPNLYYVETQVVSGNTIVDQYKTRFGFRYYEFDRDGFRVNGKTIKLYGVCLHHDQGALGAASYNDAMYRQLCIMKEMGMNAVRTSHNCPDQDFLRMCDELGFYVMDEAFDGWEFSKTSHDFGEMWKEQVGAGNNLIDATPDMQWHSFVMRSMVKRDRNCPSVFMWSCGNELHEGKWHDTDISEEEREAIGNEMVGFANELKSIARELDHDPKTKRWCGTALESDPNEYPGPHPDPLKYEYNFPKCEVARTLYKDKGVLGLNYGSLSKTEETLKNFDRVYGSETASANNSRGFYGEFRFDDKKPDYHWRVSSYDNQGTTTATEAIYRTLNYDGYGGQFVWTGFDYIGEPSPFGWNCEDDATDEKVAEIMERWPYYPNSSTFGIVDTCGFAKDTYYLYRAHQRKDDTTLHLVGSLNTNNMYKSAVVETPDITDGWTPIDVYTNAPYVLIKKDGTPIAEITRKDQPTSKGAGSYYTFEAKSRDSSCEIIADESNHSLYTRIAVDPTNVKNITAEAYTDPSFQQRINDTTGLNHLVAIDSSTKKKLVCYCDKSTITADGKSLAYITVDLQDLELNPNLITDWESQVELDVTWSGDGQVLGVDNGNSATALKFQNPEIYKIDGQNHAKIYTFAGKALIIVGSGKTPGEIEVNISNDMLGYTQTIKIKTE